jgi:enhancing lycopene biosynthesis protein 2
MAKPKIGIILSGCGYLDGSEIQEAVLTMLAVDKAGAEMIIMAPDIPQKHVINHLTGNESAGESRNVLLEAARIARGAIRPIKDVNAGILDALLFPGGFGAAKNLCDFAFKVAEMNVLPEVEKIIREIHSQGKPIGFICIAPIIAAKTLGDGKLKLTIGNDPKTAKAINEIGGIHVNCPTDDCIIDRDRKIVSTPAYMLGPNIAKVSAGIEKLVNTVIGMI